MSWAAPLFLWLVLLPLGAAVLLRRRSDVRPAARWRAMLRVAVSGSQLRAIGVSRLRPGYISLLAIALATVALARPLWGESDDGAFTSSVK